MVVPAGRPVTLKRGLDTLFGDPEVHSFSPAQSNVNCICATAGLASVPAKIKAEKTILKDMKPTRCCEFCAKSNAQTPAPTSRTGL